MDEGTKRKPRLNALPMDGVLAPYASDYNSELIQGRYAAATGHAYLCCIGHFARWLTAERIGLEGVNGEAGRRFVTEHCLDVIVRPRSGDHPTLSMRRCLICMMSSGKGMHLSPRLV